MYHCVPLVLFLVCFVYGDDPIIHLEPNCPAKNTDNAQLVLMADVPAFARAKCKNGDRRMKTTNDVEYKLTGYMDQSYVGKHCLFYKKNGSLTYTIDVEVGWGEKGSEVILNQKIHTISCAYDDHGNALSSSEVISDGFIAPQEMQTLVGGASKAGFQLDIIDVLNEKIVTEHISIGRKIRLKAIEPKKTVTAFRALSCDALNGVTSYAVLRAGCGDGLVFQKKSGFYTKGAAVFSPYFDAFKLQGSDKLQFQCNFTVCKSSCDGDSCTAEARRKRSPSDDDDSAEDVVVIDSGPLLLLPVP